MKTLFSTTLLVASALLLGATAENVFNILPESVSPVEGSASLDPCSEVPLPLAKVP